MNPNTTTGKKGIMVLFKEYLNPTFNDIIPGQLTEMRFKHATMEFQIYFIYGPSDKDDPAFFNQIEPSINHEVPVIIMGDWNVVQDTVMERTGEKQYYKPLSNTTIKNLKFEKDLLDPWRQKNKTLRQYSWEKWDKSQSSRIDYALINEKVNILHHNTTYRIPPCNTDHKVLEVCLKLNKFKRGKGFPRVKYELYSDPLFVRTVNEMIENTQRLKNSS